MRHTRVTEAQREPWEQPSDTQVFAEHRALLVGVAYRMLGSLADAEDVVQEAWLRWAGRPTAEVGNARAYLVRTVTRLAIDRMRRLRALRESYIGPWLPEPVATGPDAAQDVERAESISLALLVVLETLSPLERAVFVLREAFDVPHPDIARALGRSEASVRQLARRARAHVAARRPRFDADPAVRAQVTERFIAACRTADLDGLLALLAPDVELVGDSGGLAPAPRRPVVGAGKIARLITGGARRPELAFGYEPCFLNGGPGVVVTSHGTPVAALVLHVRDGLVTAVHAVGNPDKLGGLRGPDLH
jgi:RNA polymerase sigma-70 factor, ECF subfamily